MREFTDAQKAERSILKTYRETLWTPFMQSVTQYGLLDPGDKIAVCVSGGKDSMLLAKLMQILQRFSEVPFTAEYLSMDPGYNPENRKMLEQNAGKLGIPLRIFGTDIFDVAYGTEKGSPCYLCARMRRGALYAHAQELGCNKIALGHHLNDVIETTLIGMFYASQLQGMRPRLKSRNFPGMELIRPLYRVREDAIKKWRDANGLTFLQCACRFTEARDAASDGIGPSKRQEIKALIAEMKKTNPAIEMSLFNSLHSVSLSTFPGYRPDGPEELSDPEETR